MLSFFTVDNNITITCRKTQLNNLLFKIIVVDLMGFMQCLFRVLLIGYYLVFVNDKFIFLLLSYHRFANCCCSVFKHTIFLSLVSILLYLQTSCIGQPWLNVSDIGEALLVFHQSQSIHHKMQTGFDAITRTHDWVMKAAVGCRLYSYSKHYSLTLNKVPSLTQRQKRAVYTTTSIKLTRSPCCCLLLHGQFWSSFLVHQSSLAAWRSSLLHLYAVIYRRPAWRHKVPFRH